MEKKEESEEEKFNIHGTSAFPFEQKQTKPSNTPSN